MTDPTILFCKPGAVKAADKKALKAAGVIVVAVDNPQDVKLMKANAEISGSTLLRAATKAMSADYSSDVKKAFAEAICAAIQSEANKP